MFPAAYRKFYSILGMSFMLGLGAVSFWEPSFTPTGFVVAADTTGTFPWPVFLFGLFVGACAVGLLLAVIHHERVRL